MWQQESQGFRIKSNVFGDSTRHRTTKVSSKTEMTTMIVEPKAKKKRNPLTRLAETTQLLTRFTSKSKTLLRPPISNSVALNSFPITSVPSKSKSKNPIKFKTGGIVATAVQTSENPKKRKLRAVTTIKPNAKKLQEHDSASMLAIAVNEILRKSSISDQKTASHPQDSLAKKIKSKIKRKSKKM